MDSTRLFTVAALALFVVEALALIFFTDDLRNWLEQTDPRALKLFGAAELAVALILLAGLLIG